MKWKDCPHKIPLQVAIMCEIAGDDAEIYVSYIDARTRRFDIVASDDQDESALKKAGFTVQNDVPYGHSWWGLTIDLKDHGDGD